MDVPDRPAVSFLVDRIAQDGARPGRSTAASGAPGPKYWQQRADYDMTVELDEPNLRLTGTETITYFNNSPDPLTYLWMQLDGNIHDAGSDNYDRLFNHGGCYSRQKKFGQSVSDIVSNANGSSNPKLYKYPVNSQFPLPAPSMNPR